MTVAELARVNQWLMNVLTGDFSLNLMTGGRIFIDEAPQETLTPMVVAAYMGGSDKLIASTSRLTQVLYLVRAIADSGSYETVTPMADRIEALMVVPTDGTIIDSVRITTCFREQPHQRMDNQYGIRTVYMGGFYRIRFQPANQ